MRRPKKAKVQHAEECGPRLISDDFIDVHEEDEDTAAADEEEEPTPPKSPGALRRAAAEQVYEDACKEAKVLNIIELKARAEEKRALRLCEARDKRMDDVKKPNRKRDVGQLWNRAYNRLNNVVQQLEAKNKALFMTGKAKDAQIDMHASHVCVLQLEIARLTRELAQTKK